MQIPTIQIDRLLLVPPSAASEAMYAAFYTDAQASAAYGGPLTPAAAWTRLAVDIGTWHLTGLGSGRSSAARRVTAWACADSGKATDGPVS